jgi:type IV pilus assembly protein PilN
MARINLRPWREERRAEQQKEFLTALAGVAIVGLLFVFMQDRWINSNIEEQQARNSYLTGEISSLERKIKEIDGLKKRRDQLIARMRVIQALQGNRPVIVHMFDEVVRTLPDGIYYTSLSRKTDDLSIQGRAESNNRISSLMRKLDGSEWFMDPNLTAVKASGEGSDGEKSNDFDLTVKRYVTAEDEEG